MVRSGQPEIPFIDLAEILDTMNCGVVARDADNRVVFANATLARWLGYERAEMFGAPAEQFFAPDLRDRLKEEFEAIREGDLRVRVSAMRRKDGTTFPALIVPALWIDEFGRSGAGVGVVVDLAAVHTAKQATHPSPEDVRSRLERIAGELYSIGLVAGVPDVAPLALDHPELDALSAREKEVLAQLAAGERVAAIAAKLFISPHTVRNHLKSIYRKLGVGDQSELIHKVRSLRGD